MAPAQKVRVQGGVTVVVVLWALGGCPRSSTPPQPAAEKHSYEAPLGKSFFEVEQDEIEQLITSDLNCCCTEERCVPGCDPPGSCPSRTPCNCSDCHHTMCVNTECPCPDTSVALKQRPDAPPQPSPPPGCDCAQQRCASPEINPCTDYCCPRYVEGPPSDVDPKWECRYKECFCVPGCELCCGSGSQGCKSCNCDPCKYWRCVCKD